MKNDDQKAKILGMINLKKSSDWLLGWLIWKEMGKMSDRRGGSGRVMKKLAIAALLLTTFTLSGCAGNKDIWGTEYEFKEAEIKMMDGTVKKVKVKEWSRDDQANNIRVTTTDGTLYYSGSENIMLINEKNEATTQKSAKSSESAKNY